MKEEIKAGDIVYLKSGGPKMTVVSTYVDDSMAECAWFDQNKAEGASFPMEALTKKDPSAGTDPVLDTQSSGSWISIQDQMPESGECVLLYSPKTGVSEGAWISIKEHFEQWRWNAVMTNVSHWMPLPEPPKIP